MAPGTNKFKGNQLKDAV